MKEGALESHMSRGLRAIANAVLGEPIPNVNQGGDITVDREREHGRQDGGTLKIEKDSNHPKTVIHLIGRLHVNHIDELNRQLQGDAPEMVIDLREVTLVDLEIVRFLKVCQARGVTIDNCPPYIRRWMTRERSV
jgi:hypothetical protein